MRLHFGLFIWCVAIGSGASLSYAGAPEAQRVDGNLALAHVQKLVSFGPRPPGSPGNSRAQSHITSYLKGLGLNIENQDFLASTPNGSLGMKNIIARTRETGGEIVILASHYDTALMSQTLFVGANDGGSSSGLLLELARAISQQPKRKETVWFVFFDGEEAIRQWTESDSLYGSRYFVQAIKSQGQTKKVKAMILLDMVGDRDLALERDQSSTPWLMDMVWKAAQELGYGKHLARSAKAMTDDHTPFIEAGIPAVDLIDFDYGFFNRYWHTADDTLDKISPRSLKIVGDIVLRVLEKLSPPAASRKPGVPSQSARP